MEFNPLQYTYPSRRSVLYGSKGMVCTSQTLAAQAGLDILKQGGNAVDAAIATAICLTVLEPTSNGLGSDAFALVWIKADQRLYGLNGSGYAPAALNIDLVKKQGLEAMPDRGWLPVTIPGAPSAWAKLHKRFGRLPFEQLFRAAITYAEEGFPLQPVVGDLWKRAEATFAPFKGRSEFKPLFDTFLQQGAPKIGSLVKLPDHAKALRLLAESYCESYYRGDLAKAIAKFAAETGGYITEADLAGYEAEWVEPISTNYRGYQVCEIPPNGHGIVALMTLNILSKFALKERECAETVHKQLEALKLAFTDGKTYISDPRAMKTRVDLLLGEEYAGQRRKEIGEKALTPKPIEVSCGGTVYLCTADAEGNMVSFIQSNFKGFGSGIVIPGYGIALNDRGNGFNLDSTRDNCLAPLKKPYHTIIPGFLLKDGQAVGPFGVMGGFMQPQGHVQVMMNLLDFGMNPQEALDAPRWQWTGDKNIELEPGFAPEIVAELKARGHNITIVKDFEGFGRGQMIFRTAEGTLVGGTEPRADGAVAAW